MSDNMSRSTSPSDGEILESTSEKANTIITASNESIVDPHSRDSVPKSTPAPLPSPFRANQPRDRSRDRSRSPYRESNRFKRQRTYDHYRHGIVPTPFSTRNSTEHQDSPGPPYRSPRDTREYPRSRYTSALNHGSHLMQSKAPIRHQQHHQNSFEHHDQGSGKTSPSKYSLGYRKNGSFQSVGVEYCEGQTFRSDSTSGSFSVPDQLGYVASARTRSPNAKRLSATEHMTEEDADRDDCPPRSTEDEASLIIERRKRREAILAKHRDKSSSVVIPTSSSDGKAGQECLSPQEGEAELPLTDALPTSVLAISRTDDAKLHSPLDLAAPQGLDSAANAIASRMEGHSAADCDPMMDMQETKLRQDFPDQPPLTTSEVAHESGDISHGNPLLSDRSTKKANGEFDMFADGVDIDMFGEDHAPTQQVERQSLDSGPILKPQAIDTGMLDDWDDAEGYYKVKLGELLDGRYTVQSNLGKGMFSGVVRASDHHQGQIDAIKIVRNNDSMHKAGLKEIAILSNLRKADPEDRKHLIRLERHFDHKGHLCMVFENLSINLREVLKKFGRDVGINLKAVRIYAQQMFLGLGLLKKCNILHADLKPDNVLVNESRNTLKICDLGSASDASENEITQYLVSRFYRAPEIILGCPYDFAIDMWSIGCTLFELYTGKILFTGRTNNQMLKVIMDCRGKFGQKVLRRGQYTSYHFDDLLNFRSAEKDRISGKDVIRLMNITKPTKDLRARLLPSARDIPESEMKEVLLFADLLDRCLSLNPEKRCTPQEALRHPFITRQKA